MSDTIIRVENLGKKYIIGHQAQTHSSFREMLTHQVSSLGRKFLPGKKTSASNPTREEFWALRDLSFEIKQGDVVGVIGRNGAGKSTLLKILSRITEPTTGRIELNGRVASLLEVGTGFHAELTGRENIYLNGAILGMSRTEIKRKFDEIVDFAGIEKFLDTPVKRYSSGMYVRLAFAVAAHLEPEVLVVDEVLAVGDAEFQKKCLGKMHDVSTQEGRTVLFVSHQMAAISNLCPKCVVLNKGQMEFYGNTQDAIHYYLMQSKETNQKSNDLQVFRPSWAQPRIISARILDEQGDEQNKFPLGSNITFELTFQTPLDQPLKAPVMGVVINSATFGIVSVVNTRMSGYWIYDGPYYSGTMRCTVKRLPLIQGDYNVSVWAADGPTDLDTLSDYLTLTILETDVYGSGHSPFQQGALFLEPTWEIANTSEALLLT